MNMELLRIALRPLKAKVHHMVLRGQVMAVEEAGKLQRLKVKLLDGMTRDGVTRFQQYGLTSYPKKGADVVALTVGGDSGHTIVVSVDDRRYRMQLSEGEVALYDSEGNHVHLQNGGTIHAKASTKVYAETPLFECSENCKIGGNLEVLGTTALAQAVTAASTIAAQGTVSAPTLAAATSLTVAGKQMKGHKHPQSGGGTTGDPI